jgi:hypothetical protein
MKDNCKCRLCLASAKLRESHIIPRSIISLIRDGTLNNRFIELYNNTDKIIQDGPKEYLLCNDCEQKIGHYEKYFKESIHLSRHGIEISHNQQDVTISNIDYGKLKLFFLSLLWRMSVSSRPEFDNVCIGNDEEIIRRMIATEQPGRSFEYSVNAVIPLINQKRQEGWSTTAFVSRSTPTIYAIVVGGILYLISTTRQRSFVLSEGLLDESGRWVLPKTDFYDIPFLKDYFNNRFRLLRPERQALQ